MLLELDFSSIIIDRTQPSLSSLSYSPKYIWDTMVRIWQLPVHLNHKAVIALVEERGFKNSEDYQVFLRTDHGQNPGYADVSFNTPNDAHRFLQACKAKPICQATRGAEVTICSVFPASSRPNIYPESKCIVLPNLPAKVDEKGIFKFFASIGLIFRVNILRPPKQPFSSTAYVYLSRLADARAAMTLYQKGPLIIDGMLLHPQFPPPRIAVHGEESLQVCSFRLALSLMHLI